MRLKKKQLTLVAIFCSLLLGVTLWALYAEYDRPWKEYQKEFQKLKHKAQRQEDIKIKQLWLQELDIVDRCTTCHQGRDNIKFTNEKQPFRTHSGEYLKHHPVEEFGCVICHEGDGAALTVKAAHDRSKPILKGSFAQSSCLKCHPMEQSLPLTAEMPEASVLTEGWRLFNEYNCTGCHKLSGYERPERIAPALTKIGKKVNEDWLVNWLKRPADYLPDTKMPRFRLSDEEVGYITSYLMSLSYTPPRPPLKKGGDYESPVLPSGKLNGGADGKIPVSSLGCLGCHKINDNGTDFGPSLSNIGNKVKAEWLYKFLKDPKSYDPKTIIPDFKIPEQDVPAIVEYLLGLKNDDSDKTTLPLTASPENIEKGRRLVKDLGCRGCHEIEKLPFQYNSPELDGIGEKRVAELAFSNIEDVEKSLINWLSIKVKKPGRFATEKIVTRMPYFDINDKDAKSLVTFLLSIKDETIPSSYKKELPGHERTEMKGKKLIEKYNCLGCHKINKEGKEIGPDLTKEAKKSRTEWLFGFLKRPEKIRPENILKAGMPDFGLSDSEANALIKYLSLVSEEPYPFSSEPGHASYKDEIGNGEKLYHEIFACIGCHRINRKGGKVGPEHTDLASRLKREWIEDWLKKPQKTKPDVRMPQFDFKEWEFEALTNYLMTLGEYRFIKIQKED